MQLTNAYLGEGSYTVQYCIATCTYARVQEAARKAATVAGPSSTVAAAGSSATVPSPTVPIQYCKTGVQHTVELYRR